MIARWSVALLSAIVAAIVTTCVLQACQRAVLP